MSQATAGPASPAGPGARLQARRDARREVARAWHASGWSGHPSGGVDYRPLESASRRYVRATYDTSEATTRQIVTAAVRAYLAPLHARRIDVGLLSHEGLIGELDDQFLARTRLGSEDAVDDEHVFGITRSSIADDAALTQALFNASPSAVRKAFSLIADGNHALEFIIMTEYFDVAAGGGPAERIRSVARTLQRQRLLIDKTVSIETVRTTIRRFGRRVEGLA